jgi:hypothetical protein
LIYNPDKLNLENLYFSFLGIGGIIVLVVMVIYLHPTGTVYYFQKTLIILIFILICIMGMVAAISPAKCTGFLKIKKHIPVESLVENESDKNCKKDSSGHHPECDNFKNHTYTLMGKKYCAGCSGLFTGALLAVVGIIIYYFYGITLSNPYLIFFIGIFCVLTALLQSFLLNMNFNTGKFIFNLILVIGAFLMLIGLIEITGSIFIQLYFILLVFIWILARIYNSEKKHTDICEKCGEGSSCCYR